MMRKLFFRLTSIFIISVFCIFGLYAQSAPTKDATKDARYYEVQAIKAYQAKDFPAFLENMKQADSLRPNHPRLLYNLADAYAVNGKVNESIAVLSKLAAMKYIYQPDKDEDFNSLRNTKEFPEIVKEFAANAALTGNSKMAFTVHEKGLVTESIAYDATTKTFYLSSVAQRKILSVSKSGETKVFADQSAGLWSVSGIKIDAKRRVLWVTTSAHKLMPNLKPEEDGSSGVLKFDLQTGKLIKKYILPNQPKHFLGDLVVAANGDVYATDSFRPEIYVIRKQKDEIELFLTDDTFSSPQGLDFTPGGKFLMMTDYTRGLFRINPATKEIIKVTFPETSPMYELDGVYFYKDSLIAVQNETEPQRVVRMFLSKDCSKVERFEVLAANNPVFDSLTLGVILGDQFYFVANSQWNLLGNNGVFSAPEKLKDVAIMKIKLQP